MKVKTDNYKIKRRHKLKNNKANVNRIVKRIKKQKKTNHSKHIIEKRHLQYEQTLITDVIHIYYNTEER